MRTIATIETKVFHIQTTTFGVFYVLEPISDGLEKLGITGTEFNKVPHILQDGSEGSSATCPTVKVCRDNKLVMVPGFFGKKIHEVRPDKNMIVKIFVQEREGLDKLLRGKYQFAVES